MANSYLTRTPSSAGNRKTWTFSAWVKRNKLGTVQDIFGSHISLSGSGVFRFLFEPEDIIGIQAYTTFNQKTVRVFRDTSAWYHIVLSVDTTQSTVSDRIKLYINGVQETSFTGASTFVTQNLDTAINNSEAHTIGRYDISSDFYLESSMSHIHFIDGTAYDSSYFGETDATTGIWKPKTAPSVTYGTNGFFLKFENSGALGTDSSGNSNTFTVNGNLKQALDTPSNVYATLNTLHLQTSSPPTFSNGNTTIASIGDNDNIASTFSGEFKWYYEAKILQNPDGTNGYGAGVGACHIDTFNYAGWKDGNRTGFINSDTKWYSNSLSGAGRFVQGAGNQVIGGLTQATAGDIVGVACDSTNGRVYIHINGTYQNSGDPVNGTGYIGGDTAKTGLWFPWFSSDHTYGTLDVNFGNGFFGTTPISSAGSNGNGSLFEYDVPSGYYALNTKNINTYG